MKVRDQENSRVHEVPWKPTREQLLAAKDLAVPDVIGHGLEVVFCGINPSLYSAAVGHHYARPGNRFWPALFGGGFTERLFSPFEDHTLLELGYGLTNLVERATTAASEVSAEEFRQGGQRLRQRLRKNKPRFIAFVGIEAFRTAFGIPKATLGKQDFHLESTIPWVLPSPSGLNAHYQLNDLSRLFGELRQQVLS